MLVTWSLVVFVYTFPCIVLACTSYSGDILILYASTDTYTDIGMTCNGNEVTAIVYPTEYWRSGRIDVMLSGPQPLGWGHLLWPDRLLVSPALHE